MILLVVQFVVAGLLWRDNLGGFGLDEEGI